MQLLHKYGKASPGSSVRYCICYLLRCVLIQKDPKVFSVISGSGRAERSGRMNCNVALNEAQGNQVSAVNTACKTGGDCRD